MKLSDPLQERYDTDINISINLTLPSLGKGEFATINRVMDLTNETILERADDGNDYKFTDAIHIPAIPGETLITYYTTNKYGITSEFLIEIFANRPPEIQTLGVLKPRYCSGDQSYIEVNVFDDLRTNLEIRDETQLYNQTTLFCSNRNIKVVLNFTIPNYDVGTKHNVSIFATDTFGAKSNYDEYEIVTNKSPDIFLQKNISYYSFKESKLEIYASIHDPDPGTRACLVTSIDSSHITYHQCQPFSDTSWNNFNGVVTMSKLEYGSYFLSIYAVDQFDSMSNQIIHYFSYIPKEIFKCTFHCDYTNDLRIIYLIWIYL